MSSWRGAPRRSSRSAAAAQPNGGGGSSSASAAAQAPAAAAAAAAAAAVAPTPASVPAVAEVSNAGSTSPETEGGSGSGSGDGGNDDAEVEEVAARKRPRIHDEPVANKPPERPVPPNKASSERWFRNTHISMVTILAAIYNDLEERHSTTFGKDAAVDEAVLGFIQRIKDIGQGVTVFTVSRLQTHSLISNTVQLCHRMAADQHTRLAKDYPSEEQVEYDVYDASTDDGGGMSGDDDDDDGDEGKAEGRGKKRARSPSGASSPVSTATPKAAAAAGGDGNREAATNPSAGKKPKRAAAAAAAAAIASIVNAGGGGGGGIVEEEEEEDSSASTGAGNKGKGKKGANRSGGGSGSGSGSASSGAFAGSEKRVKQEDKQRQEWKDAKEEEEERRRQQSVVDGQMIRARFHAVVMKLVARAKWASEPVGRPHKDVITRAREMVMTIFIDSFYRRMLSLHRLVASLDQLDRMVAWADDAPDDANAEEAGALGPGLSMSEIGLTNIALTVPA